MLAVGVCPIDSFSERQQLHLQLLDDRVRDLVLDREDVGQVAVEAVGPDVPAVLAADQLPGDPHPRAGLADAALQHEAHAELLAHLLHVDGLALVRERGVAGDDEQPRDLREVGDDVLGDAVAEVFLLGVAAHVVERQHDDRRSRRRGAVGAPMAPAGPPVPAVWRTVATRFAT